MSSKWMRVLSCGHTHPRETDLFRSWLKLRNHYFIFLVLQKLFFPAVDACVLRTFHNLWLAVFFCLSLSLLPFLPSLFLSFFPVSPFHPLLPFLFLLLFFHDFYYHPFTGFLSGLQFYKCTFPEWASVLSDKRLHSSLVTESHWRMIMGIHV